MKNFASLFAIVFCGIAASLIFLLFVGANQLNTEELDTRLTVGGDDVIIAASEGLAGVGVEVYREMGCVACHTQQVRRPGYGGDFDRDWGGRQSVARDYLLQDIVMLGRKRMGPDLANVGARRDAAWLFEHLYKPTNHAEATTMPAYPQLFREKEFSGTPAARALDLQGNDLPEEGKEVVPTAKAVALVAYLQSLNLDYDLPESKRLK